MSWGSPESAPTWLHISREYTERWHHQQQIREALGRPLLTAPKLFAPVLTAFVYGLRRTYQTIIAAEGTVLKFTTLGESGGIWYLVRDVNQWDLYNDVTDEPSASVSIVEIDAWKLFTKSFLLDIVHPLVQLGGDTDLALKALGTVSIIA